MGLDEKNNQCLYRDEIWRVIRGMSRGIGLGNFGDSKSDNGVEVDYGTAYHDLGAIIALLYLYRETAISEYLDIARRIADIICRAVISPEWRQVRRLI